MNARATVLLLSSLGPGCGIAFGPPDRWGEEDDVPPPGAQERSDRCEAAPTVAVPAAICVCDDLTVIGNVTTSTLDGGAAASIGAMGSAIVEGNAAIDGAMSVSANAWLGGNVDVRDTVRADGDLTWLGNALIGGDLVVGGDLEGAGNLVVEGSLRLFGADRAWGLIELGGVAPWHQADAAPCPCDPAQFFDVAAAVVYAMEDPDVARLPSELSGNADVRLTTGRYYADSVRWDGNVRWVVEGHVDVFVADSIDTLGNGEIELLPGATLDLYVAGSIATVGNTWIGGEPGAVRIHVGGDDPILLDAGNQDLHASIYAPTASVTQIGNTVIVGSVFAGAYTSEGNLEVVYPGLLDPPGPTRCPEDAPEDASSSDGSEPTPDASTSTGDDATTSTGAAPDDGESSTDAGSTTACTDEGTSSDASTGSESSTGDDVID